MFMMYYADDSIHVQIGSEIMFRSIKFMTFITDLTRMVDNKHIDSIRVVGMQKKKEHGSSKHYVCFCWSENIEINSCQS